MYAATGIGSETKAEEFVCRSGESLSRSEEVFAQVPQEELGAVGVQEFFRTHLVAQAVGKKNAINPEVCRDMRGLVS